MLVKNNYSSSIGSVYVNGLHVGTGYFLDSTSFITSGHFLFDEPEQCFIQNRAHLNHQYTSLFTFRENIQLIMIVFNMLGRQMSVLARPICAEWSLVTGVDCSLFELIRAVEFAVPMSCASIKHDRLKVLIRSEDSAKCFSSDIQLKDDNSFEISKEINGISLNGAPVLDNQDRIVGHCICRRNTASSKYARVLFTTDLTSVHTPATTCIASYIQNYIDDRPLSMI